MSFKISDELLNIEGFTEFLDIPGTYFYLDDHNQVIPGHFLDWVNWRIQNPDRISIAHTEIEPDIRVSTVFLGINCNIFSDDPPLVFETMAFKRQENGDEEEIYQNRYTTYTQAELGHEITVNELRAKHPPNQTEKRT